MIAVKTTPGMRGLGELKENGRGREFMHDIFDTV
jgi:hypothetical protein